MSSAYTLTLTGPRQLEWQEQTLPAIRPGQVLVETLLSAVSIGSELATYLGSEPGRLPCTLGYQTLGRVVRIGEWTTLGLGDRVVTTYGHTSAAVLEASLCLPIPEHVPDRVALAVILGEETHKGIRRVTPLPHERVLVAGAGLLGLLTVFNLTRRGVMQVSVLEPDPRRRELARAFGAQAAAPGGVKADDFDVGFECSASPAGFVELLEHLRPGGRACVLSDGNWGALSLPPAFHQRELSLIASSDGEDYAEYANWLWAHPDPLLAQLYVQSVSPDSLIAAYAQLRSFPRPVSLVVDWQHSLPTTAD